MRGNIGKEKDTYPKKEYVSIGKSSVINKLP
jgi:hypothetical protein